MLARNAALRPFAVALALLAAPAVQASPRRAPAPGAAVASAAPVEGDAALTRKVEEYLAALDGASGFTGSVLVEKEGRVLARASRGFANVEHEAPFVRDTKFRIGSITKQFTATAILQLVNAGKLALDEPACQHLAGCPASWQPITVEQLLTHTAGVPNFTALPSYVERRALKQSPRAIVEEMMKQPLDFAPGARHQYSNTGYLVLGILVEQASGERYEKYLAAHVLAPAGMTSSGYDHAERLLPHRAQGYVRLGGALRNADHVDMSVPFSAGALYSTVDDLARWNEVIFDPVRGTAIVAPDLLARAQTAHASGYGYGWVVGKTPWGDKLVWHNGGIDGFAAHLLRDVEEKVTVVVLSNEMSTKVDETARALLAMAHGAPYDLPRKRPEVALTAAEAAALVGVYQLKPGFDLEVRLEGTALVGQATGQPPLALAAESATRLFFRDVEATLDFVPGDGGRAASLVLHQNGQDVPAKRLR